jgi:hypothetical protein
MTLLERAENAVGCAHCRSLSVLTGTCLQCGRPVCHRCLSPATCEHPRPWSVQLPHNAKLLRVDGGGRLGLVRFRRGQRAIVDLATGRRRTIPLALSRRRILPHLAEPERLVRLSYAASGKLRGVGIIPLGHWSQAAAIPCKPDPSPRDLLLCDSEQLALVIHDDEQVEIVNLAQLRRVGTVADPGQAVLAADACELMDLVALGTFGRVTFFRLSDQQFLGALPHDGGDVVWLGVAGGRVVVLTDGGLLEARQMDTRHRPTSWERVPLDRGVVQRFAAARERRERERLSASVATGLLGGALGVLAFATFLVADRVVEEPPVASLTPDGHLLALQVKRNEVQVLQLETGAEAVRLPLARSFPVVFLRFVRGGRVLITADASGRVRFWPRVGGRVLISA